MLGRLLDMCEYLLGMGGEAKTCRGKRRSEDGREALTFRFSFSFLL